MRLKDKLVVITAAASGMGRAGVQLFAAEGARVCAVDINGDALAALADQMQAIGLGHAIETVQADLSDIGEVRASVHAAADKLGGIDVFWGHAGIPGPSGIENLDIDAYRTTLALNIDSAVLAAGEVAGHMRKRGGGAIIYTASASGLVGSRFSPVYSATKFAVVGLAKSLCQTLGPDNIRVNALCPGLTATPMAIQFTSRDNDPEEARRNEQALIASVPLGRLCQPQEVAQAALWLASDDASFVTGIALPIDGGFTAR